DSTGFKITHASQYYTERTGTRRKYAKLSIGADVLQQIICTINNVDKIQSAYFMLLKGKDEQTSAKTCGIAGSNTHIIAVTSNTFISVYSCNALPF
ncbi:MAG: hypothetical protein WBE68_18275, partial [Candidatus Nitrosopolaris sp.]